MVNPKRAQQLVQGAQWSKLVDNLPQNYAIAGVYYYSTESLRAVSSGSSTICSLMELSSVYGMRAVLWACSIASSGHRTFP